MQFGVRSTSKFFEDNKIARARRASATCSLKKFQVFIETKLHSTHAFLDLIIYMKKKIGSACAIFHLNYQDSYHGSYLNR